MLDYSNLSPPSAPLNISSISSHVSGAENNASERVFGKLPQSDSQETDGTAASLKLRVEEEPVYLQGQQEGAYESRDSAVTLRECPA